jgi:hypothetical protein
VAEDANGSSGGDRALPGAAACLPAIKGAVSHLRAVWGGGASTPLVYLAQPLALTLAGGEDEGGARLPVGDGRAVVEHILALMRFVNYGGMFDQYAGTPRVGVPGPSPPPPLTCRQPAPAPAPAPARKAGAEARAARRGRLRARGRPLCVHPTRRRPRAPRAAHRRLLQPLPPRRRQGFAPTPAPGVLRDPRPVGGRTRRVQLGRGVGGGRRDGRDAERPPRRVTRGAAHGQGTGAGTRMGMGV